jgi:hypothetical protein
MRWRAVAGFALFATWLAFLAALAMGTNVCFDPDTGLGGIDALAHCASHRPLGLPLTVSDDVPLALFVVVGRLDGGAAPLNPPRAPAR